MPIPYFKTEDIHVKQTLNSHCGSGMRRNLSFEMVKGVVTYSVNDHGDDVYTGTDPDKAVDAYNSIRS